MTVLDESTLASADEQAEALFKEAQRRRRKRWQLGIMSSSAAQWWSPVSCIRLQGTMEAVGAGDPALVPKGCHKRRPGQRSISRAIYRRRGLRAYIEQMACWSL